MPLFFSFRERLAAAWRIIRASEWWQHKIPLLVGVAAVLTPADRPLPSPPLTAALALWALAVGVRAISSIKRPTSKPTVCR